jgi:hypothetical protein
MPAPAHVTGAPLSPPAPPAPVQAAPTLQSLAEVAAAASGLRPVRVHSLAALLRQRGPRSLLSPRPASPTALDADVAAPAPLASPAVVSSSPALSGPPPASAAAAPATLTHATAPVSTAAPVTHEGTGRPHSGNDSGGGGATSEEIELSVVRVAGGGGPQAPTRGLPPSSAGTLPPRAAELAASRPISRGGALGASFHALPPATAAVAGDVQLEDVLDEVNAAADEAPAPRTSRGGKRLGEVSRTPSAHRMPARPLAHAPSTGRLQLAEVHPTPAMRRATSSRGAPAAAFGSVDGVWTGDEAHGRAPASGSRAGGGGRMASRSPPASRRARGLGGAARAGVPAAEQYLLDDEHGDGYGEVASHGGGGLGGAAALPMAPARGHADSVASITLEGDDDEEARGGGGEDRATGIGATNGRSAGKSAPRDDVAPLPLPSARHDTPNRSARLPPLSALTSPTLSRPMVKQVSWGFGAGSTGRMAVPGAGGGAPARTLSGRGVHGSSAPRLVSPADAMATMGSARHGTARGGASGAAGAGAGALADIGELVQVEGMDDDE